MGRASAAELAESAANGVGPESVLKKRKRQEKYQEKQQAERALAHTKGTASRQGEKFRRAESFIKRFRDQEQSLVKMKRSKGTVRSEPEHRLIFVMRLRDTAAMHPKVKQVLKVLRLQQASSGVFAVSSKATLTNLAKAESHVMYGYPSLKTVRDLVHKRGFARVNRERVPITDNKLVEDELGEKTQGAVICIEDLVDQIHTMGPHFLDVCKFLWPFKMNMPKKQDRRSRVRKSVDVDTGNREELINEAVQQFF